jgi:hypothetical protein
VDQATIYLLVIDSSMGNLDASGWPLEIHLSEKLGVLGPSGLVEVAWKLHVSLSWTSRGSIPTTHVHSRHNSRIVQHCWGSFSKSATCSLIEFML